MDPSKPERPLCTCHNPLHPSMGEDLPVRFFCPLSKRAQRYYLKLSIKGQHPNNKFRRLLYAVKWGTRVIYPSRQCQGGSDIWSHKAYSEGQDEDHSSPNPHQLPSKRAQSICLFLGVPPNYSLNRSWLGLLEKQQYVCFFYLRDLSQMKDVTMTGPLWLVNKSYPEDLAWNRATSRYGLPPPPPPIPFTVLNGEHSDEWDLIYSPR